MQITILCVGKLKEKYLQEALLEYQKRLRKYGSLQIIEVPDEKTPDHASRLQEEQILDREGERLLKKLPAKSFVIALAIDGKMLTSEELASFIDTKGIESISHITFLIGGSLGLSQSILQQADMKLSFSKMTFPHQLMRVILLEQIYRSYRIIKNEPYHK